MLAEQKSRILGASSINGGAAALLLIGATLVASLAITQGAWAVVVALLALPSVLLFPIEVALGSFAFAIPFDTVAVLGAGTFTLSFLIGVMTGAILFAKALVSNRWLRPAQASLWWALFVFWTTLTIAWALDPSLSMLRLPGALTLFVLYLVAASIRVTEGELNWIRTFAIFGGFCAAAVSIYQYTAGVRVSGRASLVFGGIATNSNELAASLIVPFSLALGWFVSSGTLSHSRPRKLLLFGALSVMSGCMFLTMSRGSLVALVVVAFVFMLRTGFDKRMLVAGAIAVVLLSFAPDLFFQRLHESISSRGQGRFDIWLVGIQVVKHYGIFGAGLDNFPVAFHEFAGYQAVFRFYDMAPHNIYLQAIAETGIVGFVLMVLAIRAQIKPATELARNAHPTIRSSMIAFEAAAWGTLTHALVANLLWRKMFWFTWILLSIATQVYRELEERTHKPASADVVSFSPVTEHARKPQYPVRYH